MAPTTRSSTLEADLSVRQMMHTVIGSPKLNCESSGSRDGFQSDTFHRLCDRQAPAIVVIRSSEDWLFGGYTSVGFRSDSLGYQQDNTAFLFTLVNLFGVPPTKCPVSQAQWAVYNSVGCGPAFGGAPDLRIGDSGYLTMPSFCGFPHSYSDPTGRGQQLFAGGQNFTVKEIEVFTRA
jgi:hypothetical protein